MGKPGDLFVLNMGQPVRIIDLAKDLIRLSGFSIEQIPIVVTGTRPGEKLEEALWEQDAVIHPTVHPDILKVREHEGWGEADLAAAVQALGASANANDRAAVERILGAWIPSLGTASAPSPADVGTVVLPFERR